MAVFLYAKTFNDFAVLGPDLFNLILALNGRVDADAVDDGVLHDAGGHQYRGGTVVDDLHIAELFNGRMLKARHTGSHGAVFLR